MFPGSETAKTYQQVPTKIKHNIQFGIAPYVKESLYDIANVPFSFKFDETATSKVQYYSILVAKSKLSTKPLLWIFICRSL